MGEVTPWDYTGWIEPLVFEQQGPRVLVHAPTAHHAGYASHTFGELIEGVVGPLGLVPVWEVPHVAAELVRN